MFNIYILKNNKKENKINTNGKKLNLIIFWMNKTTFKEKTEQAMIEHSILTMYPKAK